MYPVLAPFRSPPKIRFTNEVARGAINEIAKSANAAARNLPIFLI